MDQHWRSYGSELPCLSSLVPPSFQKLWEIGNMLDTGRSGEAKDVIINNPISLHCETSAAPPPTLTWYKDGRPLTSSDRVLILPGGDCSEEGEPKALPNVFLLIYQGQSGDRLSGHVIELPQAAKCHRYPWSFKLGESRLRTWHKQEHTLVNSHQPKVLWLSCTSIFLII